MKALDTNVILRFLLNDDPSQGVRAKTLFEAAERRGESFAITWPVVLEMMWVLSAVYNFRREAILDALEMLAQMPIFEFEDYEGVQRVLKLGRGSSFHLPDLLIGASGLSAGCETTLTFEKGLSATGLFERIAAESARGKHTASTGH